MRLAPNRGAAGGRVTVRRRAAVYTSTLAAARVTVRAARPARSLVVGSSPVSKATTSVTRTRPHANEGGPAGATAGASGRDVACNVLADVETHTGSFGSERVRLRRPPHPAARRAVGSVVRAG